METQHRIWESVYQISLLYKMEKYTSGKFLHWLQQWVIQKLLEIRIPCFHLNESIFKFFLTIG